MYKGFMEHLRSIQEAQKVGSSGRFGAMGAGIVGSAVLATGGSVSQMEGENVKTGIGAGTAALVSYPVMVFASNHPVLK